MASAIKRFFEKKKLDKKFKKAGRGHTLASSDSDGPSHLAQHQARAQAFLPSAEKHQTEQQRRAADAALARVSRPETANVRTGKAAIRAQVQKELEQEQKRHKTADHYSKGPTEVKLESAQVVDACGGVFFTCDLLPRVMLPKKEMDEKIKQYLLDQLEEDAEMASALLICTVNKDDKAWLCVETLCKYLDNLLNNPGEEKFRKIRCNNKAFCERVSAVEGGTQFLHCAGYKLMRLPFQDGEEDFYVIGEEASRDRDRLELLKEVLTNSEPIRADLWRAPRLFHCTGSVSARFGELPRDFYNISKEELQREQQARQDAVEKLGMLRTKAMRERDEIRELRRYRYTLIRVRFPKDIHFQAIFKSNETLEDLTSYIREQLHFDWLPFSLRTANGVELSDESKTLAEHQLVPACLVIFSYDTTLLEGQSAHVIKQDLLERLENWSI